MSEVLERLLISAVPTDHVIDVWPKIAGFIADACVYTHGRYEAEDVLEELLGGTHLLWIAFEGSYVKGAVVTNFLEYPRAKYLSCPFVAGDDFESWHTPMLSVLQRWARDNGCAGVESTARLGWARKLKNDGYKALWQTFQLPAAEGE